MSLLGRTFLESHGDDGSCESDYNYKGLNSAGMPKN